MEDRSFHIWPSVMNKKNRCLDIEIQALTKLYEKTDVWKSWIIEIQVSVFEYRQILKTWMFEYLRFFIIQDFAFDHR